MTTRNKVVVDGMTLTRAQVEEAMWRLNAPALPTHGQVTKINLSQYLWLDVEKLRAAVKAADEKGVTTTSLNLRELHFYPVLRTDEIILRPGTTVEITAR